MSHTVEENIRLVTLPVKLLGDLSTHRTVVVVKGSACLPSTPMIQVRILLTPTVYSVKFVFERNEAWVGPF